MLDRIAPLWAVPSTSPGLVPGPGLPLAWRRGEQPGSERCERCPDIVALPVCPDPGTGKVKAMATCVQGQELLPVPPGPRPWAHHCRGECTPTLLGPCRVTESQKADTEHVTSSLLKASQMIY